MKIQNIKKYLPQIIPATIVFFVLGSFLIYSFIKISTLTKNINILTVKLTTADGVLEKNLTDLRSQTIGLSNTISNTQQNIDAVKNQVGGVEQTIGSISNTVGDIQKLAQIDSELLKKYSKVYFMNENYIPAHLFAIPNNYLYSTKRSEQFLLEGWPFLKNLIDTAKSDGVTLYIKSGYRSFAKQQSLKSAYTVIYGAGTANSFSADQGYSEHQLGTTVDFITTGINGNLDNFYNTDAYNWLINNAYKFGFELSYPKGNNYYISEPWHWRFVGIKLATNLHKKGIKFYAMDQRDIDEYLINLFD